MTQSTVRRNPVAVLDGCLERLGGCLTTLAIAGLFLFIGVALSIWGWTVLRNARASANWPVATGVVTSAELVHSEDDEGSDSWQPRVTYRYLAGDVQRTGVTIKFGVNSYGDRQTAEDILARYPVGRPALVYYDPEEPERSVLEPGVTAGSYIVLGIGVLFTALAIIVAPLIFLFGGRD